MSAPEDFDAKSGFATRAIRTGHLRTPEGEHSEPIFATSSFVFDSAAEAAARFSGDLQGNIYSRFTNPTVRAFEQRLASLEGGEACVATASGMSAILATCMGLLKTGDRILSSCSLFGSTTMLFNKYLARFGIQTSYVPLSELDAWEAAMDARTRILFCETPSNPLTEMVDLRRLAEIAHRHGCLLVVDNCFCTPALQRPLDLGADIVIHSATKFLDGQGRCVGGAVVGDKKLVGEEVFGVLRTAGPTMSPFNAWVFLKGLETLELRMLAHSRGAAQLADWLSTQAAVERVYYPGRADHPQHRLVGDQQRTGGGILAFDVRGGQVGAWRVVDATRMISITANLGDAKTTITHPATTTHGRLSPEERVTAGIADGLLRVAVGLEDVSDIQADLARGLSGL
ncbi:O-succinylhomoserine sulfhydrylase [Thiorhodococcus mannitoliphagus]|uniref:O-succinylhomoserine sulfhydrylase n=1 Tax=Thiorhodococcus mannitoliphagus TaxID=329406 RepID=A0A6P1DXU0_9GAMM|nr:O-succinylhomoserine sulfhydrylase [Thiorhodococcus mannitoliphagus]NEX20534.1 O-succinylhomoserine sulfhydrylase [Thiorhodococcus mannitoliphagus]